MKISALFLITALYLLFLASNVQAGISNSVRASSRSDNGGNSSVIVNIKNNVNTGSNTSSFKSETKTDVHISQEGEGTSSVNINGKEWKLEGPGEISVNEATSSNSTPSPTQNPTSTPTQTPIPIPDVLGDNDEVPPTLSELLENFFRSLRQFLNNLFSYT